MCNSVVIFTDGSTLNEATGGILYLEPLRINMSIKLLNHCTCFQTDVSTVQLTVVTTGHANPECEHRDALWQLGGRQAAWLSGIELWDCLWVPKMFKFARRAVQLSRYMGIGTLISWGTVERINLPDYSLWEFGYFIVSDITKSVNVKWLARKTWSRLEQAEVCLNSKEAL